MVRRVEQMCQFCGSNIGFTMSDDGFFYCDCCNNQAEDIVDMAVDEDQLFSQYSALHNRVSASVPAETISEVKVPASQFLDHPAIIVDDVEANHGDGYDMSRPSDFGSSQKKFTYEECYNEIRSRYLTGLQVMIQLQCQALINKYNVSPLIIGLAGPLWLRFLSSTGIMTHEWADKAVHDSEVQMQGELEEFQASANHGEEPVNILGKRLVLVWYRSVRRSVPLSCTLAVSFLVCHLAREPITPSDILNWTLEGKFPYFSAFHEIEKKLGSRSNACPMPDNYMFRPIQSISSQKLESMAANMAQRIFLDLPPVNFYSLALRYCMQLYLPENKILHIACRICEWAMPPAMYLSASEFGIPTRACVMSVLIVAIRILFNINGYGICESVSCGSPPCLKYESNSGDGRENMPRFIIVQLLKFFEEKYDKVDNVPEYLSNLHSYLQYCKEMVFSGLWPSYEDLHEENLMKEFWDLYQSKAGRTHDRGNTLSEKRYNGVNKNTPVENKETMVDQGSGSAVKRCNSLDRDQCPKHEQDSVFDSQPSSESVNEKVLMHLKLDMEENGFCYIPPRVRIKRDDYLYYAREKSDALLYAVHADYYILVRSCAIAAQVDTRILHISVLSLERRLDWLEKRMKSSLM